MEKSIFLIAGAGAIGWMIPNFIEAIVKGGRFGILANILTSGGFAGIAAYFALS